LVNRYDTPQKAVARITNSIGICGVFVFKLVAKLTFLIAFLTADTKEVLKVTHIKLSITGMPSYSKHVYFISISDLKIPICKC
jgi:hypothetical protein